MINCNTQFGKLKSVVVGRELEIQTRAIDILFKHFFHEHLDNGIINSNYENFKINQDIISKRIQQLDNLAKILSDLNITVYRPDKINKLQKIQTPYYSTECSAANNVRDLTFIYNTSIVETPITVRSRVFENTLLYNVFSKHFDNGRGGKWIKAPTTKLIEQTSDLDDWKKTRNFSNSQLNKYEMAIDAANFLPIGKDVIVNVTTYNQYNGFMWIKSLFPKTTFHMISYLDNHIDGALCCISPRTFLVNPRNVKILKTLPDKFKKYKVVIPNEQLYNDNFNKMTNIGIQLASSEGMDINVLSIDENTILANKRATNVIDALTHNNFNVIPIELDNGEIFGGGIHCSTLDLIREDCYEYY